MVKTLVDEQSSHDATRQHGDGFFMGLGAILGLDHLPDLVHVGHVQVGGGGYLPAWQP